MPFVDFIELTNGATGFSSTEIPHFLTNEECDYIIKVAENNGLISSIARGGLTTKKDLEVPKVESKWSLGGKRTKSLFDRAVLQSILAVYI